MRHILTTVAAIAACGLIATTSARAQQQFEAGGPSRIGNNCLHNTSEADAGNFGYMAPCPPAKQTKAVTKKMKKKS
jgi:phosphatidylethanolamine-binding protein (PEBP) family uncharacterized protein